MWAVYLLALLLGLWIGPIVAHYVFVAVAGRIMDWLDS